MNRLILIAATALVALALTGGAILFVGGSNGPTVPTPTPVPTPAATPAATAREALASAPVATYGDWIADVPAIPEILMPEGMIQLSVDFQDGERVWLQTTPDYRQLLDSASLAAPAGEIRLRSNSSVDNLYCAVDALGRYRWSRSSDGLFLTLELIEDACEARGVVFARTWVRSHGALNDGGPGVNYGVTPMLLSQLPARQWGMGQGTLQTFDETVPKMFLVFHQEPRGFADPCASPLGTPVAIEQTIPGLASYLRGLPGLTVTETATEIGGLPGARLTITSEAGTACASGAITALRNGGATDATDDIGLVPGESLSLWAVDVGAYLLVFLYTADGLTLADEEAYFSTMSFIDQLPTP